MLLVTLPSEGPQKQETKKPRSWKDRWKLKMEAVRACKEQERALAEYEREQLRLFVRGLVDHIDGAGSGCRLSSEPTVEMWLTAQFSKKDRSAIYVGGLIILAFMLISLFAR